MNRTLKTTITCLALLALPALAIGPTDAQAGTSLTAPQVAAKVQNVYNQTRTFRARFQQDYHVKAYNRTKRSHGEVTFAKPGKMKWNYDQPNGNRIVSDGKVVKVYERGNKQMIEQPMKASQYPAALSFLTGNGDLRNIFHLKLMDPKRAKMPGGYVLLGTPKQATPAYERVLIYIDGGTAQVRRMMLIDAQGNRNVFTFKSPAVNQPIPKGAFSFTPPPGTQIVRP